MINCSFLCSVATLLSRRLQGFLLRLYWRSLCCPALYLGFEIKPESMKWVSQHTNANIVETDFFGTCSTSYANSMALWIIL